MRRIFIFLALLLLIPAITARAAEAQSPVDEIITAQGSAAGITDVENALPDEAAELLDGMRVTDALDAPNAIERLWGKIAGRARSIFTSAVRNAVVIVMAAMLSGIFSSLFTEKNADYARLAAILAISAVSVANVNAFITSGAKVIDDLTVFSKALLPCLTATAAASGAMASAAVKYSATMLFMDIAMTVLRTAVMPLIFAYAATSVAEAAVGGEALAGVASLIKWLARTILSLIVVAFIIYISLTGIVAGATDAATLRAAKVAISTVLPVVGTILSDAAGAVLSGASILKGAIGVFGTLVVVATCAVPFLRLGINYLMFKIAGGLSATIADKSVSRLIDAFSTAFGLTLGLTGAVAMMLFVSIISLIQSIAT